MCNAFTQRFSSQELAKKLDLQQSGKLLEPAAVFPKYQARIIVAAGVDPELTNAFWKMIPRSSSLYTELSNNKYATNNARSESVTTSRLFRVPWAEGLRCVFPVSTFNEWRGEPGSKEKLDISTPDEVTFIAGLYDRNHEDHLTCTMLTCEANAFMRPIHNRMPVILPDWRLWLSPETSAEEALQMLRPWEGELRIAKAQ